MTDPGNLEISASLVTVEQIVIGPPTHLLTHDTERREHIISDETLMQLAYGGKDVSLEIALGAFGVAMGYCQNFAFAVEATRSGEAISYWDGIGAAIFFIAATASLLAFWSYQKNRRNTALLVEKIRNRKVGVMASTDPYARGEPFIGEGSAKGIS